MAGAVGFLVEAGVIALLQYGWQWTALPCRAVSFPAAVVVTWWLNHRYTFASEGGWSEFVRYLGTQGVGLLANLVAYVALVRLAPQFDRQALVPLVVGSAVGLAVNFLLARRVVFHKSKH